MTRRIGPPAPPTRRQLASAIDTIAQQLARIEIALCSARLGVAGLAGQIDYEKPKACIGCDKETKHEDLVPHVQKVLAAQKMSDWDHVWICKKCMTPPPSGRIRLV